MFVAGFIFSKHIRSKVINFKPFDMRLSVLRMRGEFKNYSFICALVPTEEKSKRQKDRSYETNEDVQAVSLIITYLLTPWCGVLLEKLTVLQLVKKFPAFQGTRRFITALTSVCHLSLSWASAIQSIYPHPPTWKSILILYTHLRIGLPSGLLTSGFRSKTLYTPSPHPYAQHAQPISFPSCNLNISDMNAKLGMSVSS